MVSFTPTPARGRVLPWLLLVLAVAALAGLVAAAWLDYRRFADAPLAAAGSDTLFEVARGSGYRAIVRQIRREGIGRGSPLYWRLLGRESGLAGRLHAGEYELEAGLTPRGLLAKMAAGQVLQRQFTIVDGWNLHQLRLALAMEPVLVQEIPGLSDAELAARVGIDGPPEGWFLPETYAWVKGESDLDLLRRAHRSMRDTLQRLWAGRADDLPLAGPYEALVLASIVEKETGVAGERAEVAGVFVRRLKRGMRLQTDPTVIYGMGERYDGVIRRSDLDRDTAWNTYTRAGLPPTPIALPGLASLRATLQPAGGDALYFVARGDGSGRHVFSATLEAHNRAVREYRKRQR